MGSGRGRAGTGLVGALLAGALLVGMLLGGTLLAGAPQAQAAVVRAAGTAVGEAVDEYTAVLHPPGLVAVTVDRAGTTEVQARGRDGVGAPVGPDTRFRIASMSKAFTATAVLQLADAGRLRLDQPVAELIPELGLTGPHGRALTVRHLLSHTSGLTTAQVDEYALPPAATAAATVAQLAGIEPAAAPGTRYEYLNTNYALAARIVEHTSGLPLERYLDERILTPLGMRSTVATPGCSDEVDGLARGHVRAVGFDVAIPELPGLCAGSGGIVSTGTDLGRWLRFQLSDGTAPTGERLLSAAALRESHTPQPGADGYALGWREYPLPDGRTAIGHGGTLTTFTSDIVLGPDGGGAAVLTNAVGSPGLLDTNLLAALDGGQRTPVEDPASVLTTVQIGLLVLAVVLSVVGVLRAPRYVRRHPGRVRGAVVPVLTALLGLALPGLVATAAFGLAWWPGLAYTTWLLPHIALLGLAMTLGGLAVLLARALARGRAPAPA